MGIVNRASSGDAGLRETLPFEFSLASRSAYCSVFSQKRSLGFMNDGQLATNPVLAVDPNVGATDHEAQGPLDHPRSCSDSSDVRTILLPPKSKPRLITAMEWLRDRTNNNSRARGK